MHVPIEFATAPPRAACRGDGFVMFSFPAIGGVVVRRNRRNTWNIANVMEGLNESRIVVPKPTYLSAMFFVQQRSAYLSRTQPDLPLYKCLEIWLPFLGS